MANFDTGTDILANFLRRAGEILPTTTSTTGADHLIDAKLYVNQAYWDICALKPWRWCRRRTQFASIAQNTGTVTTVSGVTITLDATVAASKTGYKFMIDADGIPHRISAHTGGTNTLTLNVAYTGDATSGSYTIFQDEIQVATDILAFPHIVELGRGDRVRLVPETELREEYPRNIYGTVRAQYAAFITDTTVRLAPWPQNARLFECAYNYRPAALDFAGGAADTPIIPQDSRIVISQRAWEMLLKDKRDARSDQAAKETAETLTKMGGSDLTFAKPRVYVPRGARVS